MRDDLLDAQASVSWVFSNLPAFTQRIESWLGANVEVGVEDQPAPATHDPIVAIETAALPLDFNVEAGAYVNAARSSLDILATALAHRYKLPNPDKMCFPIAENAEKFARGKYTGSDFVKGLPIDVRKIVESVKPFKDGNEGLWALHDLDIVRKHRRLLDVEVRPVRLTLSSANVSADDFVPVATGTMRVNEKTVLGLIRKGAANYDMKFMPYLAMKEAGLVSRRPVTATLAHFAGIAESIIGLFDIP